jgi:hypothetical protein
VPPAGRPNGGDHPAVVPGDGGFVFLARRGEEPLAAVDVDGPPFHRAERKVDERACGERACLPDRVVRAMENRHRRPQSVQRVLVPPKGPQRYGASHQDPPRQHAAGLPDRGIKGGESGPGATGEDQRHAKRGEHVRLAVLRARLPREAHGGAQLADGHVHVAKITQDDAHGLVRNRGIVRLGVSRQHRPRSGQRLLRAR